MNEYLTGCKGKDLKNHLDKRKAAKSLSIIEFLCEYFKIENNTDFRKKFLQVTSGEGDELNKIITPFSSSCQSLLFFYQVSNKNPITIFEKEYNEVYFEFLNPVLQKPSSIDVVLVNKDKGYILFIESKLSEMIESSRTVNHSSNYVIGSTYFAKDGKWAKRGFSILKLNEDDYKKIGIEENSKNKKQQSIINPINGNQYVYSEGIKQILAHTIGIINFQNGNRNSNIDGLHDLKDVTFLSLHNSLPGYNKNDAQVKIDEFVNHVDTVFDCLKEKGYKINFMQSTYQEVYKNLPDSYRAKLNEQIVKYYKLDK